MNEVAWSLKDIIDLIIAITLVKITEEGILKLEITLVIKQLTVEAEG